MYTFHYQGLLPGIKVLTQEKTDKQNPKEKEEAGLDLRKPCWDEG